jgi:FtsH-binding integral membrane protein
MLPNQALETQSIDGVAPTLPLAVSLKLDFINLFLIRLRIFGRRN